MNYLFNELDALISRGTYLLVSLIIAIHAIITLITKLL
jgi:hypothetical protein